MKIFFCSVVQIFPFWKSAIVMWKCQHTTRNLCAMHKYPLLTRHTSLFEHFKIYDERTLWIIKIDINFNTL